ncbi:MAG: tRNA (guanosine(37)-N1)-methyltransferase TrmD [Pseudomonadota bacterium]
MRFDVITIFPGVVQAVLSEGVVGRAMQQGRIAVQCWNPRDFTSDRHRTVDDRPFGGGPGMVMKAEPLLAAIAAAKAANPEATIVYLSPQGRPLDQRAVEDLARRPGLILLAGRYEGVDERVIEATVDEEWSIGDYVLSGGELPALVLMDAVSRLLPGTLGHQESAAQDSFSAGLLDCPHYTRPELLDGWAVPAVLLSGDHARIARWRHKQALGRTWERRPDLLARRELTPQEEALLAEYRQERGKEEISQ